MRLKRQSKTERHEDKRRWRKVFAVLPKTVGDGDIRWLEMVEMRYFRRPYGPGGFIYTPQYRAIGSDSEGYPSGFDLFGEGPGGLERPDPPKPIPTPGVGRVTTAKPQPRRHAVPKVRRFDSVSIKK